MWRAYLTVALAANTSPRVVAEPVADQAINTRVGAARAVPDGCCLPGHGGARNADRRPRPDGPERPDTVWGRERLAVVLAVLENR
jgi:hypothetical protein